MATDNLARGIRNNNPLNIRISRNDWLGKVVNNTDGAFEQFSSQEYGLRAAFINIRTIVRRRAASKQATRVRELIHIWAPAADNNNEHYYCKTIADKTGIQPTDKVNLYDKNFMCLLVYGMAIVECGTLLNMARISNAYDMAYGKRDPLQLQVTQDAGANNQGQP